MRMRRVGQSCSIPPSLLAVGHAPGATGCIFLRFAKASGLHSILMRTNLRQSEFRQGDCGRLRKGGFAVVEKESRQLRHFPTVPHWLSGRKLTFRIRVVPVVRGTHAHSEPCSEAAHENGDHRSHPQMSKT